MRTLSPQTPHEGDTGTPGDAHPNHLTEAGRTVGVRRAPEAPAAGTGTAPAQRPRRVGGGPAVLQAPHRAAPVAVPL